MVDALSAYTRLTLMIGLIKENRADELISPKDTEIVLHSAKLSQEYRLTPQEGLAGRIADLCKSMFSFSKAGHDAKAEEERESLLSSCIALRDAL